MHPGRLTKASCRSVSRRGVSWRALVGAVSGEKNVLGTPLEVCGTNPMTGFYRDGCCCTGPQDMGRHVVCSCVNAEFLAYTKAQGNDLSSPNPMYGFPGLKPGDRYFISDTTILYCDLAEVKGSE